MVPALTHSSSSVACRLVAQFIGIRGLITTMPLAALLLATLPLLLLLLVLLRNVVSDYSKLREVPGPQSICSLKTLLFGLFGDGTLGKHGLVARHRAYEEAQGEHRLVRIIIWPLLSRLQFFLCDPDEPVPRWMNKVDSLREP